MCGPLNLGDAHTTHSRHQPSHIHTHLPHTPICVYRKSEVAVIAFYSMGFIGLLRIFSSCGRASCMQLTSGAPAKKKICLSRMRCTSQPKNMTHYSCVCNFFFLLRFCDAHTKPPPPPPHDMVIDARSEKNEKNKIKLCWRRHCAVHFSPNFIFYILLLIFRHGHQFVYHLNI